MTSTSVTEVGNSLLQATSNAAHAARGSQPSGDEFGKMMDLSSQREETSNSYEPKKINETASTKVERSRKDVVREAPQKETDKVEEAVQNSDVEEEVEKVAEEIVNQIAEQMGISKDDLNKIMEAMNISLLDVLNKPVLTALITEISGGGELALMTDENLYATFSEIASDTEQALSDLGEALNLSPEEMEQLIQKLQESVPYDNVNNAPADEKTSVTQETIPVSDKPEEPTVQFKNIAVDETAVKEANKETKSIETPAEPQKTPETVVNDKPVLNEGNDATESKSQEKESKEDNRSNLTPNFISNNVETTESMGIQKLFSQTLGETDRTDIIRQITDYMQLQTKNDLTQMEIQLHPASLGTINLSITSKAGVITAAIQTQNEAVKAAIESQVITLRENLENQGVKVEAVEVTVASHEFERNLEKDNKRGNAEAEATKSVQRKALRRLNLNEAGIEGEEDILPEEKLAKEIMEMNGNTVDYTA